MFFLTTDSSLWSFDFDSMMFTRMPRAEDEGAFADHISLSYSKVGAPAPFLWVKPFEWPDGKISYRVHNTDHVLTSGLAVETRGEIPDHILEHEE